MVGRSERPLVSQPPDGGPLRPYDDAPVHLNLEDTMPCISSDGTLTVAAKKVMTAMKTPISLEDVAAQSGLPLYQIRSSVRELVQAGLVEVMADGKHATTEAGRQKLAEQR